jgi:hypothetical protein
LAREINIINVNKLRIVDVKTSKNQVKLYAFLYTFDWIWGGIFPLVIDKKYVLTDFKRISRIFIMINRILAFIKNLKDSLGRPQNLPIFVPDCGWNHGEDRHKIQKKKKLSKRE